MRVGLISECTQELEWCCRFCVRIIFTYDMGRRDFSTWSAVIEAGGVQQQPTGCLQTWERKAPPPRQERNVVLLALQTLACSKCHDKSKCTHTSSLSFSPVPPSPSFLVSRDCGSTAHLKHLDGGTDTLITCHWEQKEMGIQVLKPLRMPEIKLVLHPAPPFDLRLVCLPA